MLDNVDDVLSFSVLYSSHRRWELGTGLLYFIKGEKGDQV